MLWTIIVAVLAVIGGLVVTGVALIILTAVLVDAAERRRLAQSGQDTNARMINLPRGDAR